MTKSLPPLEAWQTRQLRLTVFPGPAFRAGEQNWWQELFGERPANAIATKNGEFIEEGPFDKGNLTIYVHPARIDLRYDIVDDVTSLMRGSIPTLGELPVAIEIFSQTVFRWLHLAQSTPLLRIAFGGIAFQTVADKMAVYEHLSAYLPFKLSFEAEDTSDFLYQINRRRKAQAPIPNLNINRLTKWSEAYFKVFRQVSVGANLQSVGNPVHFSQVEFDINTDAEFTDLLPSEQLASIYSELTELAQEIATNGDIP